MAEILMSPFQEIRHNRSFYMDQMVSPKYASSVTILMGTRHDGKSSLLDDLVKYIMGKKATANIIRINFKLKDSEYLRNGDALQQYIWNQTVPRVENYILIEEIKDCPSYVRILTTLQAHHKYHIYLTSSFNLLRDTPNLVKTLHAHIIPVFPFSFQEYSSLFTDRTLSELMTRYMREGGFPASFALSTTYRKKMYSIDTVENRIFRNLIMDRGLRNEPLLHSIILYLIEHNGTMTSIHALAKELQEKNNLTVNHRTVGSYVEALCDSFFFYQVSRYDIRRHQHLSSGFTYYLVDPCLQYAHSLVDSKTSHIYENIVIIDLIRRGYHVTDLVAERQHRGFSATKGDHRFIFHVAEHKTDFTVMQREAFSLCRFSPCYRQICIAPTHQNVHDTNKLHIVDTTEWLLHDPSDFTSDLLISSDTGDSE